MPEVRKLHLADGPRALTSAPQSMESDSVVRNLSEQQDERVARIRAGLSLPLIVAPLFLLSTPALTVAACREGVIGSFPAHGTRTVEIFEEWLKEIEARLLEPSEAGSQPAPFAVNLVAHASNLRFKGDLELCVRYRVPIVLSSKSSPVEVVERVHAYGGLVFHDVANRRHAEKAIAAGVDGLIAVAGGAGGHTGTINPFALMNELRSIWSGPIVLAGGMTTGRDVFAAEAMGADFAYMGTRFIATREAAASEEYKRMILDAAATDIFFSASVDGAPANWLTHSLVNAGYDLDVLRSTLPGEVVSAQQTSKRWRDVWSAGHGVGNILDLPTTQDLCRRLRNEYERASSPIPTQANRTR